jgi:hypothetical protein
MEDIDLRILAFKRVMAAITSVGCFIMLVQLGYRG